MYYGLIINCNSRFAHCDNFKPKDFIVCFVDLHSCIILQIKPTLVHYSFLCVYFTILYMFRVNMCPSSGEVTV